MTTRLSKISTSLGLDANTTLNQLLNPLNVDFIERLDGIPSSTQSAEAILQNIQLIDRYSLFVFRPATNPKSSGVTRIKFFEHIDPAIVGVYSAPIPDSIPDELEMLTLWASIDEQNFFHEDEHCTKTDWRHVLDGRVLVAIPKSINELESTSAKKFIAGVFSLQLEDNGALHSFIPELNTIKEIRLEKSLLSLSSTALQLINDVAGATSPKWRMLSMYRILENGYLANIRDELLSTFDRQPATAIKKAQDSLSSETNQLVSLAETKSLKAEFEVFSNEFDSLVSSTLLVPNRFALAIDHELKADKSPLFGAPERFKKGIARLYKIRCAIAHAGTASIVYEQFQDADNAIDKLHNSTSAIVQKLLAIRTTPNQ